MSLSDLLASTGVTLLLIAFVLETAWVIAAISTLIRRVPRGTLPVMSKFVNLNCSTWNINKNV